MTQRTGDVDAKVRSHLRSQPVVEPLFSYDLPIEDDPIRLVLDRRVPWAVHGEVFSQQSFGTGPWPDQGWKLHVSATPLSASAVLEAALDVLLDDGVRFKVVGSIAVLGAMNCGTFGVSQIGKFITVYPSDDDHAVRLAVAVDERTRGHRGPRVPTDRTLRPHSLVHYRYGSMRARPEAELSAAGENDLLDPLGRLTNDVRLDFYRAPHPEITDPFEAAGVRVPLPARGPILEGRYFVSDALAQSARGGVFRAIDLNAQPARLCLIKEAWHDVALDQYGRDARDWADNEEQILSRYGDDAVLPRFYDAFEVDGDRYMAIEYVEGTPLDKVLFEEHSVELGIELAEVVAIGLATADALAHLHDLGLVFRDFKPANLIKTPEGRYRLIDYGITYEYRSDDRPPLSIGTPPFFPREQYDGDPPRPVDDVYAWGAVLHYLAGGDESITDMPKGKDLPKPFPRRPIAEIRPTIPAGLARVIDRAVAWERQDRYPTMREARAALAEAARELDRTPGTPVGRVVSPAARADDAPLGIDSDEALRLARDVGDALCLDAEEVAGGLCWMRRFEWTERTEYSPDLYGGTAGVGLFLAELARATGESRYADAARGAARWLTGPTWGRGRAQHGFQNGEGGVAFFLLRLAELLDAPGYVTAAEMRVRRLHGAPWITTDLLYGTAGTLYGTLAVHAATGDPGLLAEARMLGDQLAAAASPAPGGGEGCCWEVPSATPGGPVVPFLGLLHGAAGIGLALAHLGAVTADERYLDTAGAAAELLLGQARVSTDVESGSPAWSWPGHLGDHKPGLQAHCHGAGGIAQFFLALDRLQPEPRYRLAAEGAATAVAAQRATERRSAVCHGLSGTGHLMLECHQHFDDERWLALARECGALLEGFRAPDRPGVYRMSGSEVVSPDLMLGFAGPGSLLLRLADPDHARDPILGPLKETIGTGGPHV
jgi:hypothetical protein